MGEKSFEKFANQEIKVYGIFEGKIIKGVLHNMNNSVTWFIYCLLNSLFSIIYITSTIEIHCIYNKPHRHITPTKLYISWNMIYITMQWNRYLVYLCQCWSVSVFPIKLECFRGVMRWSNCSAPIPPGTPGDITFFVVVPVS